ncbi:MAG: metallophosphoesterase [Acidimicrobiales bacterium]|nr:metallophosphoesterase [Acidimicrobiales bacterium]
MPDDRREDDLEAGVDGWLGAMGAPRRLRPELTTVGVDEAVVHHGRHVERFADLSPDTSYEWGGFSLRTLPACGELLSTVATVNDVHFGEEVCGHISGSDIGPVFRSEPGEAPYPEVMSEGAVEEIAALDPDLVLVKGDLTSNGTVAEYDEFRAVYEPAFDGRLLVVRGNHESYNHATFASEPFQLRDLPGVRVVLLDTSIDGGVAGTLSDEQLEWLDTMCAEADRPVLVFGHHPVGDRNSKEASDRNFGIDVDVSESLVEIAARRPRFAGYFAGHTHRNRLRRFASAGDVPWGEVACVKDYPGAWAEYRVYEGNVVQVMHRISTSAALAWTDKTRHMFEGLYRDYAFGSLADRCFSWTPRRGR